MANARKAITGRRSAKDIIGGHHGELSTAETVKARKAFNDYRAEGGDLAFADFVREVWKSKTKK